MDVPNSHSHGSVQYNEWVNTSSTSEILPQSGNVPFSVVESADSNHQTAGFSSINPGFTYDIGDMSDTTRGAADTSDLGLDEFFKRPIRLSSFIWTVGTPFYQTFNPLKLFLNQKRVANRISNYRNMRGRIHMRFMINGTPFNRGLMIVHARPLPLIDSFSRVRALVPADKVSASQMPHIYLNPTTSQGGDLVLPFFWPYNSMNLVTTQMDNAWEVIMRDMSPLANSQGSNTCTIQILAWMEDIVLSSPTDHNVYGIVPQSGEEDEYGNKPASAMASAVARASGALVDAPVIGKYARATEMAAKAVGAVANTFGYSRPVELTPRLGVETLNIGSLSNYNLPDATVKLSLDAKKETVVDPRVVGLGPQDEMHLATLAQRESYLMTFTWSEMNPAGTVLQYFGVTPNQHVQYSTSGGPTEYHMTPSCWITIPFQYWRGAMKFRFKVIASNFHKGRLRVTYDPVYSRVDDDFNAVQSHIFDIAETKDFTVQVGWASEQTYLEVADLSKMYYSSSTYTSSNLNENGTIRVEVFTNLTTSDPTVSDERIEVLVFTSMCEDFEVASPRTAYLNTYSYNPPLNATVAEPQSGDELLGEGTTDADIPVRDTVEATMGGKTDPTSRINDVCFGESVTSWKQCLQRYCFHHATKTCLDATTGILSVSNHYRPDFPVYRGYTPSGVHTSASGPYNFVYMTIINWVVPAYAAWRGALRWKYMIPVGAGSVQHKTLQVHRSATNNGWVDNALTLNMTSSGSALAEFYCRCITGSWNGAHTVANHCNNVCSIELPYYSAQRFMNARRKDQAAAMNEFRSHSVNVMSLDPNDTIFMAYVAAADDFICHFFLGVPVCWRYDNPAAV